MREWITDVTIGVYTFLLPISWIGVAIILFVLLPMSAWRRTRGAAAVGLIVSSYLFGATTWFLGAGVTFGAFGWIGLIIGLVVLGFGVVPLGIIGAFFRFDSTALAVSLLVMSIVTLGTRFAGAYLGSKTDGG